MELTQVSFLYLEYGIWNNTFLCFKEDFLLQINKIIYEFTMRISFLTHVNNLDAFHVIFLSWKFNLHFLDHPIIPKALSCLMIAIT
jgi:hypothetical protein